MRYVLGSMCLWMQWDHCPHADTLVDCVDTFIEAAATPMAKKALQKHCLFQLQKLN